MHLDKKHLFFSNPDRPLVFGHRGTPLQYQENTLPGFQHGVRLGIDGIELDTMLSKDGKLVVFHDASTLRMTGHSGQVRQMNWEQLKQLRINRTIRVGQRVLEYDQTASIPLLQNVLEELKGKLLINIEIKGGWRTGVQVAKLVRHMGLEQQVFATSFQYLPLLIGKQINPGLQVGSVYSLNEGHWQNFKQGFSQSLLAQKAMGASLLSGNIDHLSAEKINRLRRRDLVTGAWTLFAINASAFASMQSETTQIAQIRACQAAGIDFFISDDPERLTALLNRQR